MNYIPLVRFLLYSTIRYTSLAFLCIWSDGEVELLFIKNDFGVVVSAYFSLFENRFVYIS